MNKRTLAAVKIAVFAASLLPLALLVFRGFRSTLGPDPVLAITHATGFWTLYFLLISLAVTPVRRLNRRLAWLIHFRRMLGLFAFFYGTLHLLTYVWLYSSFDFHAMAHDIVKRPFITMGMFSFVCLLALAATSTTWAIRKLGGRRWQLLHRLVYVAAIAGIIHYWWIVKSGVLTPWKDTAVLTVLLLARVVWTVKEAVRKKKRVAIAA